MKYVLSLAAMCLFFSLGVFSLSHLKLQAMRHIERSLAGMVRALLLLRRQVAGGRC